MKRKETPKKQKINTLILNFLGEYKVTVFVTSWVLGDGFNSGLVKQVTTQSIREELKKKKKKKVQLKQSHGKNGER